MSAAMLVCAAVQRIVSVVFTTRNIINLSRNTQVTGELGEE